MGDTVTTMRFYEQIKREKRAKEKWNQKYLTAEQLELERQAEAAAIAEHAERTKPKKKLNERDAMLARLHAVELLVFCLREEIAHRLRVPRGGSNFGWCERYCERS